MKTRWFLIFFALLQTLAAAGSAPPNILFFIADDWGPHVGAYGTRWVQTPAFDRVAKEGLLFKNAYTPMAKCAPSRAILLTGRHLWQLEEAGNHLAFFPEKFKSWPEVLLAKGWHVGMTGKGWGPGVARTADGKARQLAGPQWNAAKLVPPTSGIGTNDYAGNFAAFLKAAPANTPWCFWCGSIEPHRAYEFQSGVKKGGKKLADIDRVPEYWPDTETVRHDMLDYAFELEQNDRHLQRILEELERQGQLDNTLLIVTSDHGMPFPRVKGYAYHDSNHIPLAIRWPSGIVAPGRVVDEFVSFVELAPTVLDVAKIPHGDSGMMPVAGSSWSDIFSNKSSVVRDHVLVGKERTDVGRPQNQGYPIRGIVTREFLYLKNYEPGRWPAGNPETGYLDTDGGATKSLILERGRKDRRDRYWQWNFGLRPEEELYNLRGDADCVKNLAGDASQAPVLSGLRDRLLAELKQQGDPRTQGRGHVFDEYKPTAGDGFYEKFMRGEKVEAGWVEETDFENPVPQQP